MTPPSILTPPSLLMVALLALLDPGGANDNIVFPDSSTTESVSFRTAEPLEQSSGGVRVVEVVRVIQPQSTRAPPAVPSGCSEEELEEGFCLSPSGYPDHQLLRNLVRNRTSNIEAQLLFGNAERQQDRTSMAVPIEATSRNGFTDANSSSIATNASVSSITTRISEDTLGYESTGIRTGVSFVEETPVCDSREHFVYPRTARNLDREWRFVINVPSDDTGEEEYVQAVKVERCLRPGGACNIDSVTGGQTVCRQKYTMRRLLALSDNGQQYIDTFRFPSCCVCYKKRSFQLELLRTSSRMGSPIQTSETEIMIEDSEDNGLDGDG